MTFNRKTQQGVSLSGLMFVLAILGMVALVAAKILPSVSEYSAIKKAIEIAKSSGSVREIQLSFDKQSVVNDIKAISGKDLEITKNGEDTEVSFAYEKKIPLAGPASLLLEFAGSTDKSVHK